MSVERSLPLVRERKEAILAGDAALIAEQKKAGKLTARERIAALLDEASFVELDVLNADAGVVAGYIVAGHDGGHAAGEVMALERAVLGQEQQPVASCVEHGVIGGTFHPLKQATL